MKSTVLKMLASEWSRALYATKRKDWGNALEARERVVQLCSEFLPSGSGFDSGTTCNTEESTETRIVLSTSFHHMTEHGFYDGWTEHTVIITPAFDGFSVRVTGKDRNGIKEFIAEEFRFALGREVWPVWNKETRTLSYSRTEPTVQP